MPVVSFALSSDDVKKLDLNGHYAKRHIFWGDLHKRNDQIVEKEVREENINPFLGMRRFCGVGRWKLPVMSGVLVAQAKLTTNGAAGLPPPPAESAPQTPSTRASFPRSLNEAREKLRESGVGQWLTDRRTAEQRYGIAACLLFTAVAWYCLSVATRRTHRACASAVSIIDQDCTALRNEVASLKSKWEKDMKSKEETLSKVRTENEKQCTEIDHLAAMLEQCMRHPKPTSV